MGQRYGGNEEQTGEGDKPRKIRSEQLTKKRMNNLDSY
jgi:hypothetical protein